MRRTVLALTLVAALAATFAPSHPAGRVAAYSQCPANTECGWEWFSDAAHTHNVGGHTTNCQGVILDWGVKVGYSLYIQQGCGGGPVE
jgi:hypothetical protein